MITRTHTRNQVLPFYSRLNQQARYRNCDQVGLRTQGHTIPPAQIVVPAADVTVAAPVFKKVFNACTNEQIVEMSFDTNHQTIGDYFVVDILGTFVGGEGNCGEYYISFQIDDTEYISEVFQTCCDAPYKLEWWHDCDVEPYLLYSSNFRNELEFDTSFRRPTLESTREGVEDGSGLFVLSKYQQFKRYAFDIVVPDYLLDSLDSLKWHDNVNFYYRDAAGTTLDTYAINNIDVEVGGSDLPCTHLVTISFNIVDETLDVDGCCTSAYANAPYEDCEDPAEQPENPCDGKTAEVTPTDDVLTGTSTGFTSPTYRWYRRGQNGIPLLVAEDTQSITMTETGTYDMVVSDGVCSLTASHYYVSPCDSFDFHFEVALNLISVIPDASVSGESYSWEKDVGAGFVDAMETDADIAVTESGYYRCTVTDGTCTAIHTIYHEFVGSGGLATPTIAKNGDELTATPSGCTGTPSYEWRKDDGTGSGFTTLPDTGDTITLSGSGLYQCRVTCDAQTSDWGDYVYVECNDPCAGLALTVSVNSGEATAALAGCAGTADYTYYMDDGDGWHQAGVGAILTLPGSALYEVRATCDGECEIRKKFLYCEGGGSGTCCISVNNTPLDYVPTESGNLSNLNELVKASDGTLWIIDSLGNGMRLTKSAGDVEVTDSTKGIILTSTDATRWRITMNDSGQPEIEEL